MESSQLIIIISGLLTEALIFWFFFGKRDSIGKESGKGMVEITVEGGYKPSTIILKKDKKTTLRFIRKDENSCLEEVIFPDYGIKKYLPLNKPVDIELKPPHATKTGFHCGMNMFQGRLVTQ